MKFKYDMNEEEKDFLELDLQGIIRNGRSLEDTKWIELSSCEIGQNRNPRLIIGKQSVENLVELFQREDCDRSQIICECLYSSRWNNPNLIFWKAV